MPLRIRGATPGARAGATASSRPTAFPGSSAVQLSLDALLSSPADDGSGRDDGGGDLATAARRPQPGGMPPVVVLGGPLPATITEVRRAAAHDVAVTIDDVVASRWAVMDEVDESVRPARYGDVAVLLPARTALATIEEALEEARIPYRLEGVALLWGSDEVRDILAVLRAVDDPVDRMAVLGALRSPGLACGDDDLVTWRQGEGTWDPRDAAPPGLEAHPVALAMEVLARLHDERWWREPSAMVGRAFDELHSFELCLAYHRPRDHWQRLRWLRDQARLFDETVGGSLRSFLGWAEQQGEEDRRSGGVGPPDPDDDAVRIMTIHASKGLEFPVVVLAGLEREVAPGARGPTVLWSEDGRPELRAGGQLRTLGFEDTSKRERELDTLEAYRLLYVAMTRARDHLIMCLHHKRLKENSTATPTIAARLQEICAGSANQWRRLPLATLTPPDVADDEEAATEALALIRAGFGLDAPDAPGSTDDAEAALAADAGTDIDSEVEGWRAGVDAFATRRAEALAATRRAPVTTATAVADQVAHEAQPGGDGRRAAPAATAARPRPPHRTRPGPTAARRCGATPTPRCRSGAPSTGRWPTSTCARAPTRPDGTRPKWLAGAPSRTAWPPTKTPSPPWCTPLYGRRPWWRDVAAGIGGSCSWLYRSGTASSKGSWTSCSKTVTISSSSTTRRIASTGRRNAPSPRRDTGRKWRATPSPWGRPPAGPCGAACSSSWATAPRSRSPSRVRISTRRAGAPGGPQASFSPPVRRGRRLSERLRWRRRRAGHGRRAASPR